MVYQQNGENDYLWGNETRSCELANQIYMSLIGICCCLEIYLLKCPLTPGAINYRLFKIIRVVQLLYIFCCELWKNFYSSACQTNVWIAYSMNIKKSSILTNRTNDIKAYVCDFININIFSLLLNLHKSLLNFLDLEIFFLQHIILFPD